MLFNSFSFLLFFPIVTILYFILPHRVRWLWLLLASVFFYMNFVPVYILILAFTIIVDYFAGLFIEKTADRKKKKILLIISILSNIGVLAIFKYINFGISNLNALAQLIHWNYSIELLQIALPIGLSFHTFQSLSYIIEVYRGNQTAEKRFGIFALYVMFYPQLVAGPIERPQHLLHQFKEKHHFNYDNTVSGLKLMAIGFFKKVVVADRLAEFVDLVFGNPGNYQGWPLIIGAVFFAFQIYYDFSGYTDIARGAARVMGFELMANFNNPYYAKSIAEFWKRWHISLSSWFKDYVYIPLGGNRVSTARYYVNIMVVFLLSGLWHGANWTYVIWGGLNGIYLLAGHAASHIKESIANFIEMRAPRLKALHGFLQIIATFTLACLAWIFFRANTISDALYIFKNLFTGPNMLRGLTDLNYISQQLFIGRGAFNFALAIAGILCVEAAHAYAQKNNLLIEQGLAGKPWYIRWALYYTVIIAILAFGIFSKTAFIYFQF